MVVGMDDRHAGKQGECVMSQRVISLCVTLLVLLSLMGGAGSAQASDLAQIREQGVLRHLGIPYANFVTGHGDGLDVELMQRFAAYLGVQYAYVESDWGHVFGDLTGNTVVPDGDAVKVVGHAPIRGDLIANGLTKLAWRQAVINYSEPTFPTQVWCITRGDSPLQPIAPSGDINRDIQQVKALLQGNRVMGKSGTCLEPGLYGIGGKKACVVDFEGSVNDIAPAVIMGDADVALLDVPDSLVALGKWSGKIKVLGPVSPEQEMGVGFRKNSPELRAAFNTFFAELKASGEYNVLVEKYYPAVFRYYSDFFSR